MLSFAAIIAQYFTHLSADAARPTLFRAVVAVVTILARAVRFLSLALVAALCIGAASLYTSDAVAQSVIESRIDGDFEGWEGETVVKLMNGQIWIQTEYYYEYHYAFMPDVLIYHTGGGWKMRVDGINKSVGVAQLR